MDETLAVLALVKDLIFASRITATGRAAGVGVRIVREPGQLAGCTGRMLLVDLNQPAAIEAAAAWQRANPDASVVGFVSHVDAQTIQAARQAGIQQVLARSTFAERLAILIAGASGTGEMMRGGDDL